MPNVTEHPGAGRPIASERVRVPRPLLARRIPSGRGATEQPNAAGDGVAPLTLGFWAVIVGTGVAAGLFGDLLMAILSLVEHLAFGYHTGSFAIAADDSSLLRRIVVPAAAGIIGGVAWYLVRRTLPGESTELDDAIWRGEGELGFRRSLLTSVISEVVIGMGASLGREAAPKLMGGVTGSVLARWARLTPGQRRLVVACGGGAGFAAVYNVPLAGALFTAEVLCGALTVPVVLPALACSATATAVGWWYLPDRATYLDIPAFHTSATLIVWAILAGPVVGLASAGYVRLIAFVSHHRASGRWTIVALPAAFLALGGIGCVYPQLFGNGKGIVQGAFIGSASLGLLFTLFALKPLVTAMCLGGGASGGLFTPTLAMGAALGGALGLAWSGWWPGASPGAFALVGAAATVGAAMQAPLTALVVVLELTHSGLGLVVPMVLATTTATHIARRIDGYSIYTARLGAISSPE